IGPRRHCEAILSMNAGDVVRARARAVSPSPPNFYSNGGSPQFLRLVQFIPLPNPTLSNGGRTVVTPTQVMGGLVVNREITAPATGTQDFARTVEVLTNSTQNTVTTPVQIVGNLGAAPAVFATQNGNLTVEPSDLWVGTDDADGSGAPAVIHYIHGPAGLQPSTVSVTGDNITWTFNVILAPNQTVRLATFTIMGTTRAAAVVAANALVGSAGFGGQAAAFLTPDQLQTVANFGFPAPVASLAFLQQPLSGQSGQSFGPTVTVRALDTFGNAVPDGTVVSVTAQGPG